MTYTVLSHVEERYEADQGKASTGLKQSKDTSGNQGQKRGVISAISGVRSARTWAAKLESAHVDAEPADYRTTLSLKR